MLVLPLWLRSTHSKKKAPSLPRAHSPCSLADRRSASGRGEFNGRPVSTESDSESP